MTFKVGDRVITRDGEIGVIDSIVNHEIYPIIARFSRMTLSYTKEGRFYKDESDVDPMDIRPLTKLEQALK